MQIKVRHKKENIKSTEWKSEQRQREKLQQAPNSFHSSVLLVQPTLKKAFGSRQFDRAMNKAKSSLPYSPGKRKVVINAIVSDLSVCRITVNH